MGLINKTQNLYYTGNDFGGYQFTSLDDIINQFEVAYVGENKIIPKIKRADISFHAMRALQELSFDTFKSIKAQQIDVPASLTMILPQDYVNYTKLSWVDSAGIKHPLYPTSSTSNPFQILQLDDGEYSFGEDTERLDNPDFSNILAGTWNVSNAANSNAWNSTNLNPGNGKYSVNYIADTISLVGGELEFALLWNNGYGVQGGSRAYGAWQRVDVSLNQTMDLRASATSAAQILDGGGNLLCDNGIIRVGITTTDPAVGWSGVTAFHTQPFSNNNPSPNYDPSLMDLGYVEWVDGTSSEKELLDIDVTVYNEIWVWVTATSPWTALSVTTLTSGVFNGGTTVILPTTAVNVTHQKNLVDEISIIIPGDIQVLSQPSADKNSSTWNNYKSGTPSENNNDDYEDDTYWPMSGSRYGLDPQHAQAN